MIERIGEPLSTNSILVGTLDSLPQSGIEDNAMAFATDVRGPAEGVGDGTGQPVWFHKATAVWMAYYSGEAATT